MSNTKGSMLISNADAVGTELVNQLGGTGYKPTEWSDAINLLGIKSADIPTALAGITPGSYSGSERGSIKYTTGNAVGAMLNKKYNTNRGFKPVEWEDAISKLTPLPENTVSGDICNIQDGADEVPIKSWEVEIAPTLTGKSAIECTQTGKNIYDKNAGVYDDTYFNQDGTTSHYADVEVSWIRVKPNTKYTFSLGATPSRTTFLRWINCDKDKNFISRPVASYGSQNFPYTVTTPNDCQWVQLAINEYPAAQISSNDWIIQIEENSSATAYEAYNATQYTATLGRTIYGGTADVVNGEGQETFARIDLGSLTYTLRNNVGMQSNGISSLIQNPPDNYTKTTAIASDYTSDTWQIVMNSGTSSGLFGVSGGYICFSTTETDPSAFKASMSGKYLVFPLATPTDFTFDGQEVNTRLGYNAFLSDEGDTEVTYRASGTITPVPVVPTLISKTITENGTYDAEDDDADGYSSVTVNVSGVPSGDHDDPFGITTDYTRCNISNLYSAYYIGNGALKKEVVFQMASGSGYEGFCISLDGLDLTEGTDYTLTFVLNVPAGVTFSGAYPWGVKHSASRVPASGSANTNTFNITPTVNFAEQTGSQNVSITFTAGSSNYLLVLLSRIAGSVTSWITMRDIEIEEAAS